MKTTLSISTIILLGGLVALFAGCNSQKLSTTQVVDVWDFTFKHHSQPQTSEILSLYDFNDNKWNGAKFDFTRITDISLNQDTEVSIPAQNPYYGNELQRNKDIIAFKNNVIGIIATAQKDTDGRWHSSIYIPIATKLNLLSQSTAQTRIMVVNSDLMENTWDISFYHQKTLNSLKSSPETFIKYFESKVPIGNLSGIQIYLVFQPTTQLEDYQFRVVSGFYRQMLTALGAKVTIAANLAN